MNRRNAKGGNKHYNLQHRFSKGKGLMGRSSIRIEQKRVKKERRTQGSRTIYPLYPKKKKPGQKKTLTFVS